MVSGKLPSAPTSVTPARRDPTLDNLKGLLVSLVVAGHVLGKIPASHDWRWPEGSPWEPVYCFIGLWHMPAFIFVSGYLSSARKTLIANARELLSLYIICQILWCGFLFVLMPFGERHPSYGELTLILPGTGLWYLLSLFFWRAATPLLDACKYPRLSLAGLAGLGAALGLVVGVGQEFTLSRAIAFSPFFAAGFWCRKENWGLNARVFSWRDLPLFVVALGAGAYALQVAMHRGSDLLAFQHSYHYSGIVLRGVPFRLAYYVAAFGAIRALFLLIPKQEGWLTRIGLASLSIYIGHFYVLEVLRVLIPEDFWPTHMFWVVPALVAICSVGFSVWRFGDRLLRFAVQIFDWLFVSPVPPKVH